MVADRRHLLAEPHLSAIWDTSGWFYLADSCAAEAVGDEMRLEDR